MNLPFRGNSGCAIAVVEVGGRSRIRKSTENPGYAPRLQRQAEKQKRVRRTNTHAFIHIPEVISENHREGSYAFDMEHFRCDDAVSFFEKANQRDIDIVVDRLIQFVDHNIAVSPETTIERETLLSKYKEVQERIKDNALFTRTFREGIMQHVGQRIHSCPEGITLPVGHCHGDLTFSNILIAKDSKHVVLIDWLDSFIETPLQDIVKLRQDTKYHWSFNLYARPFDRTKIMIIMDYIDKKVISYFSKRIFYEKHYPVFQLLNFFRILPYVKDASIAAYLERTMSHMIREIPL